MKRTMSRSLPCCLILLVAVFSEFSSGAEPIIKYVCEGDYVKMFQNISLVKDNPVNLYINGVRQTLIGTWTFNENPAVLPEYKEKLFLDETGTLLIRNIQLSEEGKYVLSYKNYATNMKSIVQIYVMIAPTKNCKPNIKRTDIYLNASLETEYCGRPAAKVHWLEHPDLTQISTTMVKPHPDKEDDTFFACAETQAQTCVKVFQLYDYCSSITLQRTWPSQEIGIQIGKDKDSTPPVSSEVLNSNTVIIVLVVLVVVILAVSAIAVTFIIQRRKNISDRQQLTFGPGVLDELKSFIKPLDDKALKSNGISNIGKDQGIGICPPVTTGTELYQRTLEYACIPNTSIALYPSMHW